jgi:hypothetical protein
MDGKERAEVGGMYFFDPIVVPQRVNGPQVAYLALEDDFKSTSKRKASI